MLVEDLCGIKKNTHFCLNEMKSCLNDITSPCIKGENTQKIKETQNFFERNIISFDQSHLHISLSAWGLARQDVHLACIYNLVRALHVCHVTLYYLKGKTTYLIYEVCSCTKLIPWISKNTKLILKISYLFRIVPTIYKLFDINC